MPRRKKFRHCGGFRGNPVFKPQGVPMSEIEVVALEHDELEALRLCDAEGLTQEEAGERMGVSRGTIQRLVTVGRAKLVNSLLRGTALEIVPTRNISEIPPQQPLAEPPAGFRRGRCRGGAGWGGRGGGRR
jgi:predicted DNA-binding protein (UPF0251 family)